jgi:ketosteroid isomerase-like protein
MSAMPHSAIASRATDAPPSFGVRPGARDPAAESELLERARQYLAAIEAGATGEALAAFYAPDVEQAEFPNRLMPAGAIRRLPELLEGAASGQRILRAQRFEVRHAHVAGATVILELLWVGTLAVPVGALAVGAEMRAHFCQVLEYQGGRIWRQRNYDCFEPF